VRTDDIEHLSSELVVHAARLIRAVRRLHSHSAGARILSVLDELGPATITALATADHTSQPTMSGAVRHLEAQGWVERTPNPADARSTLVVPTEAGRAELARVRKASGRMVSQRFAAQPAHSPEDLATAVAVLRDLLDAHTTTGGTTP
jgi:DNA-binding MarR family transcriptional regulator